MSEFLDKEARYWMGRYRVPLMIWAWDDKDDIINPPNEEGSCLVAWTEATSGTIVQSRDIGRLTNFLNKAPSHPDWRRIYTDVPVRTDAEVKAMPRKELLERSRQTKVLKVYLTLWLAAIPTGYAVFEFFGPQWIGLGSLVIAIWQALKAALKIWGHAKPSAKEQAQLEKDKRMEHYFFHCERNPEGFSRLKIENFENDSRERILKEAAEGVPDESD